MKCKDVAVLMTSSARSSASNPRSERASSFFVRLALNDIQPSTPNLSSTIRPINPRHENHFTPETEQCSVLFSGALSFGEQRTHHEHKMTLTRPTSLSPFHSTFPILTTDIATTINIKKLLHWKLVSSPLYPHTVTSTTT